MPEPAVIAAITGQNQLGYQRFLYNPTWLDMQRGSSNRKRNQDKASRIIQN